MKVVEELKAPLKRLDESFAFAFKSVDKKRFGGLWPRFSYLINQWPVTLIHSTDYRMVPAPFNGSTCAFLNQEPNTRRMAWVANNGAKLELLRSHAECTRRLRDIEPRLCNESLTWGGVRSP